MVLLRYIQIASYVAGILCALAAPAIRVVHVSEMAPHVMLFASMSCFLCSIATKFLIEAFEAPKEEIKSRAAAA
jgi:hypothetical protein